MAVKVIQMFGRLQFVPSLQWRGYAPVTNIGRAQINNAVGRKNACQFSNKGVQIGYVLNYIVGGDNLKAGIRVTHVV